MQHFEINVMLNSRLAGQPDRHFSIPFLLFGDPEPSSG